jgi:beta-galactosidase/beta-glucuronidase
MKKSQSVPRPEHPKPQFERGDWINLNGPWTFSFDFGKSGEERGFPASKGFEQKITVPFCPESELSGIGHKDFIEAAWWQRKIEIPSAWDGKLVLLHFGAADWRCDVWVDGKFAGRHFGGSSSFYIDITDFVKPGSEHSLVVGVKDEMRTGSQPGGKQCFKFKSAGCHYTRVTGIWQTVWLEAASPAGLKKCRITPDFDNERFVFTPEFHGLSAGNIFRADIYDGSKKVSSVSVTAAGGVSCFAEIKNQKTWSPESPFLYDIVFSVADKSGKILDTVKSYAGMRKIHIEGDKFLLNNKPVYLRFVLDQGFYPDGIWTAPDDTALKRDIELSMKAGFNGARLHQKVFEERFHYWADRLGYLTWAEFPSWGVAIWGGDPHQAGGINGLAAWNFFSEWREVVERDLNHPSIIAWTPLNETRNATDWTTHNRFHRDIHDLTKAIDPSRPVNEASGYVHAKTDLWTVHNYTQDGSELKKQLEIKDGQVWKNYPELEAPYKGQPYYVDECGGIKWIPPERAPNADNSWGYGQGPRSIEEFYTRLEGQINALLETGHVRGYCYTQLTDVEQEQNGVYNYDRTEKFDMKRIAAIFGKTKEQ